MRVGLLAARGFLLALGLAACAQPAEESAAAGVDYAEPGPYAARRHTWALTDAARARTFEVEVWSPAVAWPASPQGMSELLSDPTQAATFAALLAASPADCASRTSAAHPEGEGAEGGPWPLVMMSHCHGCTRFSTASVAAHLATHGFVVVAPDHAGNTLFDTLAGAGLPLDTETLALREGDVAYAHAAALAGELGVQVNPDRVGAFGHSFGAVTVGSFLQQGLAELGGPRAALFVGAPPENPLLPGVEMGALGAPLLFLRLAEDHSVGEAGNLLMAANFEAAPGVAWQVDMADAGHWSPSDLVGLVEDFMPGCGEDTRAVGGGSFAYLPAARGRALTGFVAAAFFAWALEGAESGAAALAEPPSELEVTANAAAPMLRGP